MIKTPDQIERCVERYIDHLDRLLLSGQMSQDNYDQALRDVDRWADEKYCEYDEQRLGAG